MRGWCGRLLGASLVVCCAWPSAAYAQGGAEAAARFEAEREARDAAIGTFVVLGTVSSTVFTLGGATFANLKEDKLYQEKDELEKLALLDIYLHEFDDDVRDALALGVGDELEDLTAFSGHLSELNASERSRLRAGRGLIEAALVVEGPHKLSRARAVRDAVRDVLDIQVGKEVSL